MTTQNSTITGLSESEVIKSRTTSGRNSLEHQEQNHLLHSIIDMVKEPMFLLLVAATAIYFITGEYGNGIFMAEPLLSFLPFLYFKNQEVEMPLTPLKNYPNPNANQLNY